MPPGNQPYFFGRCTGLILNEENAWRVRPTSTPKWEGYWERGSYDIVKDWLEKHSIPKFSIHTSGHASPVDLKQFATALNPRKVVPIHSFAPGRYSELFSNVQSYDDGEWWEI